MVEFGNVAAALDARKKRTNNKQRLFELSCFVSSLHSAPKRQNSCPQHVTGVIFPLALPRQKHYVIRLGMHGYTACLAAACSSCSIDDTQNMQAKPFFLSVSDFLFVLVQVRNNSCRVICRLSCRLWLIIDRLATGLCTIGRSGVLLDLSRDSEFRTTTTTSIITQYNTQ